MSNCKVISFFSKSTQIILITVLLMNTDHLHMAKLPIQSAGVQIVTTVTLVHFTVKSLIWNLKKVLRPSSIQIGSLISWIKIEKISSSWLFQCANSWSRVRLSSIFEIQVSLSWEINFEFPVHDEIKVMLRSVSRRVDANSSRVTKWNDKNLIPRSFWYHAQNWNRTELNTRFR